MESIKISAPAKINLHLQITSRRSDGFHNIVSLFQMISLYDELEIGLSNTDSIGLTGSFNCSPENNLIYRAAEILKRNYGIREGVSINCRKNIPSGGGLGGGSSDAAATLTGLNLLFKLNISKQELSSYALELGSDVPFFLGSSTAVAQSRGEVLTPVESRDDLTLLLIETFINSSTEDAFNSLDLSRTAEELTENMIMDTFKERKPSNWPFFNTFTPNLFGKYPVFKDMVQLLNDNGSEFSNVTGTGSSVFGVFSNATQAEIACKSLKKLNIRVHKLKMLANRPRAVYN